jgi:hypothetical protein
MKIEKVYPAGWKMETGEETIYFGEYGQFGCYCNDGVVYKDRHAFETGVGVCYINEYGFDNDDENRGRLFEFGAKEAVASGLENNSYTATEGWTRKDLEALCEGTGYDVENLFDHLDWMSPETLMDEWLEDDEEQEALKEGK